MSGPLPLVGIVLAVALVLAAAAAAWAIGRLWSIAGIGAAYKAKVLCSTIFVSGRDIDPQRSDEISADSYWLLRPLRAHVDRRNQLVSASFFGLQRKTAVYRAGLGATLVSHERP